jgi:hypothetical protein
MEVWLVNAAHIKAISRRKTDVKDAEWIAQLLECGLLRPSMVPPPDIRRLRMLTRYRVQLMGDRTREITRLELMLEDASVKLSSVAGSLTSVSARAMLGGESDPRVLAELAKGKMRRKIPALTEALTGHFDAHHAQLARSMLARISAVEAALAELNAVIAAAFRPLGAATGAPADDPRGGGEGRPGDHRRDRGRTCPASRPRSIWPPGPGSRPAPGSRQASGIRSGRRTATSG